MKTVIAFLVLAQSLAAQDRYLVQFKDKGTHSIEDFSEKQIFSDRSILRRRKHQIELVVSDLPLYPQYLNQISQHCNKILLLSRWWNGCMIEAFDYQVDFISTFPFVQTVKKAAKGVISQGINSKLSQDFGLGFEQANLLGIVGMHRNGFTGKGVMIGLIDSGFQGVDTDTIFENVAKRFSYFDLIHKETSPRRGGDHGTMVLSTLAAYDKEKFQGVAPDAEFVLLRTENNVEETPAEEFQLLVACEIADSLGVDIINISLGYNEFDDSTQNYTYLDMDGKTTLSSWACNRAAQSGMLVVSSAGNFGDKTWRYISAPADADSVIAVGAVDFQKQLASFSSRGPSADGRTKPDVVAPGYGVIVFNRKGSMTTGFGTSFASPMVAGLAAGILQARPELKSWEIKDLIIKTSSHFATPNDSLGFGLPDFMEAYRRINPTQIEGSETTENVYPKNPLKRGERLCLDFSPIKAFFKDLQGKTQVCQIFQNCILINNDLKGGIYFLEVYGEKYQKKFRVLIL
jgi:subtilisin family serine protease